MFTVREIELREKLAAIEHERWADWQKWCHDVLRENCPSPKLEKVLKRWDRQIAKPYSKLSKKEKASDREQVDRYFPLVLQYAINEKVGFIDSLDWVHWQGNDAIVCIPYDELKDIKDRLRLMATLYERGDTNG